MPSISKIRFTNVIYENGGKRYNDDIFHFDGYNGAVLLANGGGKTVFVQTALQAILPHQDLGERKIRNTLSLEGGPCHIAIEWIINEKPRQYALTGVTLFLNNNRLDSYRYVYEYGYNDNNDIENIPFIKEMKDGKKRPVSKGEINEYYQYMKGQYMNAKTFDTIKEFHNYIENNYKIIPSEWKKIALINGAEGGVERFFDGCKTNRNLLDKLLIPVVEEAVSENGTKDFVDTFEKQREHFKIHKQLRDRIEESKKIEREINNYVDIFSDYNRIKEKLNNKKQYGKGMFNYIKKERNDIEEKLSENLLETEELEMELEELNREKMSYDLALLKNKLEKVKASYDEVLENYKKEIKIYRLKNKHLSNLEIAKTKRDIKKCDDIIKGYKEEIELLKEDVDIKDIKDKLDLNGSNIKGYFINEIDTLKKKVDAINGQIENYKYDLKKEREKLNKATSSKETTLKNINNKKGRIDEIDKSLKFIKNSILDRDTDDVIEQQKKWKQRIGNLEEDIVFSNSRITTLEEEKEDINSSLKINREKLNNIYKESSLINTRLENINENHDDLLNKIQSINNRWDYVTSLYTNQDSILNNMENKIIGLREEKEQLLLKERIITRLWDYYRDNDYFMAEPLLEKWVKDWTEEFSYIELGTRFIQRVSKNFNNEETEYFKNYRYWAITIIVYDKEIDRLKGKISEKINDITYPVFLLSEDKAREVIEKDAIENTSCIFPKHWKDNLNQTNFKNWKDNISSHAINITNERKNKEKDFGQYNELLNRLYDFYNRYPYEGFQHLNEEKNRLNNDIHNYKVTINNMEERLNIIGNEISSLNQNIIDSRNESSILNNKVQKGQEYITKKKEKDNILILKYDLEEKLKVINNNIVRTNKEISSNEEILNNLNEELLEMKNEINNLKSKELYNEVKSFEVIYSDKDIEVLKIERKRLKDRLYKKKSNIENLEENLKRERKNKEELETTLKLKRKSCDYEIDEDLNYPIYGDREMEKLTDEIMTMKPDINKLEDTKATKEKEYNDYNKEYSIRVDDFHKEYEEIIVFTEPLYKVKDNIDIKEKELIKRGKNIKSLYKKLINEKEDLEDVIRKMELGNAQYNYLIDDIKPLPIKEEIKTDFSYNRSKYVDKIIEDIGSLNDELEKGKEYVGKQRNLFIVFCENEIKHPKLKKNATEGVRYRTDYQEIIDWKNKMQNNLSHIIKISQDHMREHDRELKQFIDHLYTYMETITTELGMIPKKTRIKIEDKWKQMYNFNIPKWNGRQAKDSLGEYIDWLIKELENREYKNEDGSENEVKIRKEIEKWLDPKQLIGVVLNNKEIKISCRKVTNDGRVSSAPTSWQSSNNWSGGEKWSKNMTLFLGILNYLAEKRQNITTSQRNNRTVIMDNPFGKASSDHVLDPVFFIAEKLGFQIIALTAHTEGKFIRNYFPVVYSLKLREANREGNLIIDKEKEISHIFFKDNAPDSLMRLEDTEQMTLF